MALAVLHKTEVLNEPTFRRQEGNWLAIYDNTPRPYLDLRSALTYLYLASFLPGVGPKGIRKFDAQDHARLQSQVGWVEKFAEESDRLKAELNQIEAKLRTDKFVSVLQWLRDLKP